MHIRTFEDHKGGLVGLTCPDGTIHYGTLNITKDGDVRLERGYDSQELASKKLDPPLSDEDQEGLTLQTLGVGLSRGLGIGDQGRTLADKFYFEALRRRGKKILLDPVMVTALTIGPGPMFSSAVGDSVS